MNAVQKTMGLCAEPPRSTRSSPFSGPDRKSTRLNSSHTVIYTLSLHDALPILGCGGRIMQSDERSAENHGAMRGAAAEHALVAILRSRSEEHTSELQSHSDLHSFPTRRSSDLGLWRPDNAI